MCRIVAICTVLVLLVGCGQRIQRPTASVSGLVAYQGKPLDHGRVVFIHKSGQGAAGNIGADGRYALRAILGPNVVMVECFDAKAATSLPGRANTLSPASQIPARYADHLNSGLTCDVKSENNTANFDLKP